MADVYTVFGTLLALAIVFPGMLIAWWLMFPKFIARASARIELTPWRCLALGGVLALPIGLTASILFSIALGPANFIGAALVVATLAFASLGASALASMMGRRLEPHTSSKTSRAAAYLRGAVALELSAAFPVIGWFIAIPIITVSSLGAAAFAALGWMPRGMEIPEPLPVAGAQGEPFDTAQTDSSRDPLREEPLDRQDRPALGQA